MSKDPAKIPVSDDVKALIERILHERFDPLGVGEIAIKPGADFTGEPAIFVDADFPLSEEPMDPTAIADATGKARVEVLRALNELGEDRFPHIQRRFSERQKVVGSR